MAVEDLLKAVLSKEGIVLLRFGKHIKSKILEEYKLIDINEFLVQNEVENIILEFLYLYFNKGYKIMGGKTG